MIEFIVHLIKFLIVVLLGVIYLPLNHFLLWVGGQYQTIKKNNIVLYWLVRIAIFPIWGIAAIFSAPYEIMLDSMH
jgi:hypothetical protein